MPGLRRQIPLDRPELRTSSNVGKAAERLLRAGSRDQIPWSSPWYPGWASGGGTHGPPRSHGVPLRRSRGSQGGCLTEVVPARGVHAAWSVDEGIKAHAREVSLRGNDLLAVAIVETSWRATVLWAPIPWWCSCPRGQALEGALRVPEHHDAERRGARDLQGHRAG